MQDKLEQGFFLGLLLLITLAFGWLLKPFFFAIFWAGVVTVLFHPLHKKLLLKYPQRQNLVALAVLLLSIVLAVLPVLLISASVVNEAVSFYQKIQAGEIDLGKILHSIRSAIPGLPGLVERLDVDLDELQKQTLEGAVNASRFVGKHAISFGQNTAQFFVGLALMLYLTFFLLRDGQALLEKFKRALPMGDAREHLLFDKVAEVTRATIKGNLLVAVVQGALGGLIFWILDIPGAMLWAVLMAVLSLVPAMGPPLVWVPVAIYLFATGELVSAIVLVVYGMLVIGLADNLLRPILVGRDTQLPDYLVLFSTLGGFVLFGVSGFVMGPLLAALFVAFWEIFAREFNPARGHGSKVGAERGDNSPDEAG